MSHARSRETVRVILSREEAEDLCWAYAGHKPAQTSAHTRDALNRFRLAAVYGNSPAKKPTPGQVAVDLTREEASALGHAVSSELMAEAMQKVEDATNA